MLTNLLIAWLNIAFNHKSLYQLLNVISMVTAMNNLLGNANLLPILFTRIAVIGIYNTSWILQITLSVEVA